jgi:hypothetical protein
VITTTALVLSLCVAQAEGSAEAVPPPPRVAQPSPPASSPPSFEHLPGPVLLAAGLGLGVPFGGSPVGGSMSQLVKPQLLVPLQVGFRITPEVMAGAFVDMGFGAAGTATLGACHAAGGSGCGATSVHVGVQGRYAFTPTASRTPWVSAGAGWESTGVTFSGASVGNLSYSGTELRLGAGYDLRNDGRIGYGLFVDGALGWYQHAWGVGGSGTLPGPAAHGWVQAGVRMLLLP